MHTNREKTESIALNFAELRLICCDAERQGFQGRKMQNEYSSYKIVIESQQTLFFWWHWHIGYPALPELP
jgi:hypothetical protein